MAGDNRCAGVRVRVLPRASCFYRAGLRPGDRVVAVNGEPVSDELEFRYHAASPSLTIEVMRHDRPRTMTVAREPGTLLEVGFHQPPVRRCANRCIFCFIDQMPPGLRTSLYVKDEDLNHSFLNGNYVTLTGADRAGLERVVRLGLSPLYVSVHAADPAVRNRLLGRKNAPPVMAQLSFLTRSNIRLHTQIVVCPGYNDGAILASTVKALFSLGENLLSIAVVPVGLTRFRRVPLRPVDAAAARRLCREIGALSDRDAARNGRRRLFLADEIFLRAGKSMPPAAYYGEYPQIGNGVGLARQFIDKWNKAGRRPVKGGGRKEKCLLLTSVSAFPFLSAAARQAEKRRQGLRIRTEAVPNVFFGDTVTVAGLLTARDVMRSARKALKAERYDGVLLPAVMFNYAGYTLDGWSIKRIRKAIGVRVVAADSMDEILDIK